MCICMYIDVYIFIYLRITEHTTHVYTMITLNVHLCEFITHHGSQVVVYYNIIYYSMWYTYIYVGILPTIHILLPVYIYTVYIYIYIYIHI